MKYCTFKISITTFNISRRITEQFIHGMRVREARSRLLRVWKQNKVGLQKAISSLKVKATIGSRPNAIGQLHPLCVMAPNEIRGSSRPTYSREPTSH